MSLMALVIRSTGTSSIPLLSCAAGPRPNHHSNQTTSIKMLVIWAFFQVRLRYSQVSIGGEDLTTSSIVRAKTHDSSRGEAPVGEFRFVGFHAAVLHRSSDDSLFVSILRGSHSGRRSMRSLSCANSSDPLRDCDSCGAAGRPQRPFFRKKSKQFANRRAA